MIRLPAFGQGLGEDSQVALLYDAFGIRRVEVVVNYWPSAEKFLPGDLSRLFGELNGDDLFSSLELYPESGARFDGENWLYDLAPSSVRISCTSYSTFDEVKMRIRTLLEGTRKFFEDRHGLVFYSDDVRNGGNVPEDKGRNVGEVVQKKLLTRVKVEDRNRLPGLTGAGLRLVGDAPEGYHWHATIEPPHGAYSSLYLWAQLMHEYEADPPRPGPDLDRIDMQVDAAYQFVNGHLLPFARKLFT